MTRSSALLLFPREDNDVPDTTFLDQVARGLVRLTDSMPPGLRPVDERFILNIDRSSSMSVECGRVSRLEAAKRAVRSLLDARQDLGTDDQVAVIMFDHRADLVLPFASLRRARRTIDQAMHGIRIRGGTDLREPLTLTRKILPAVGAVRVVLLTDGHGGNPVRAASTLKKRGAIVETIGVGFERTDVNEPILKSTASVVNGRILYRFLQDPDELERYFRTEVANRLVKLDETQP